MIILKSAFDTKEFSCSVPDVVFTTSGDYADVIITATKSGQQTEVFKERLYPDTSGQIEVVEMDRLIEAFAEQWLVFQLTVSISDSTSAIGALSTQVVSCKAIIQNITAADFCNTRFLTLLDGKRPTSMGWLEFLTYVGTDAAACIAYYSDGSNKTFAVEHTTFNDDYSMIDVSPEHFATNGKQLVRFIVTAGERQQEYEVIDDYDPDIAPILLFFNSFGVQELAYCVGEHQMVSSYDRKQARIGRIKQNYSIEEKSTFKADTGILSFPMAGWWREVFRSKDIQVMQLDDNGKIDQNSGMPVIINTEKVEVSNEAGHLPRFTFEYEYADRNHNVMAFRKEGRIFDNTFDYTFN